VADQVLRGGTDVVLDFGCWSPEERWAIRAVAEQAGATFHLEYLALPEPVRRDRAASRWRDEPSSTFPMSGADQDAYQAVFEPPTPDELAGSPVPDPPGGHRTWLEWAS